MTQPVHYATATAFRQALETRLMNLARAEHVDVQRLRRQVAFDRLLCRLFKEPMAPWVLKGGYAMELRLTLARTTRDIDLTLRHQIAGGEKSRNNQILTMLQAAVSVDTGDYFVFLIGEPIMDLEAAPYGGGRFPVEARMDGRIFSKFHLDVGTGDAVIGPLETVRGRAWLNFAGIDGIEFTAISCNQQFAEKYHAYTLPRQGRENSRARDMVDMLLLIRHGRLNRARVMEALCQTFDHRRTHPLPATIPSPPASWEKPFAAMANECGLSEKLNQACAVLAEFIHGLSAAETPSLGTKVPKP